MKHLGKTPPFRGPNGEILPSSIAEIRYLPLGGLDQWMMIRGENIANPLLMPSCTICHFSSGDRSTRGFLPMLPPVWRP
jgi:hypothetical protein